MVVNSAELMHQLCHRHPLTVLPMTTAHQLARNRQHHCKLQLNTARYSEKQLALVEPCIFIAGVITMLCYGLENIKVSINLKIRALE